jgi:hypothetical protein
LVSALAGDGRLDEAKAAFAEIGDRVGIMTGSLSGSLKFAFSTVPLLCQPQSSKVAGHPFQGWT